MLQPELLPFLTAAREGNGGDCDFHGRRVDDLEGERVLLAHLSQREVRSDAGRGRGPIQNERSGGGLDCGKERGEANSLS